MDRHSNTYLEQLHKLNKQHIQGRPALIIFPKKILIFFLKKTQSEKIFYIFSKEALLMFWEMELFNKASYIPGGNFLSLKNKENHSEKITYITDNKTF